jgi:tetratricopeptide (TPR) repeat protein
MLDPLTLTLTLTPASDNCYPLQGILIPGASPRTWLAALSQLKLEEQQIHCYAVPDLRPNQIWGCLVVLAQPVRAAVVAPYMALQCVHNYLFIPEQSRLVPELTAASLQAILFDKAHFLHPTLGLVELFEPLDWATLLQTPEQHSLKSHQPEEGLPLPKRVRVVTVEAAPLEDSLSQLDAVVPEREDLQGAPLSAAEVFRLRKLRAWRAAYYSNQNQGTPQNIWSRLQQKLRSTPPWTEGLQAELDELEKRYQNPMNRLVDLLKEDPEQALRYAIPLDNGQIGRGYGADDGKGTWDWVPRWASTGLFQQGSTGGYNNGRSYNVPNNKYYELQQQYRNTAAQFIQQKKFEKAAFVYLRLLRDPKRAAEVLEMGEFYEQAASIYLKYLNEEAKAAACYEKANRLEKALALYKKLERNVKVGNIYEQLGQQELALVFYEKALEDLIHKKNYLLAANFCKDIIKDLERAKQLAFAGWVQSYNAAKCLHFCLDNLPTWSERRVFLEELYAQEHLYKQQATFLQVLRHIYGQEPEQCAWVRALAYRVVTEQAEEDVNLLRHILYFNPKDAHLSKDILRYRLSKR